MSRSVRFVAGLCAFALLAWGVYYMATDHSQHFGPCFDKAAQQLDCK